MTDKEAKKAMLQFRFALREAFLTKDRTSTEMLAAETIFDPWTEGSYQLNDVRKHDGQLWRCCQAHDSTGNPGWYPGAVAALWAPYHTTNPEDAKPYIAPTGAHDAYQTGEVCVWTDGKVYRCKADATVHDPATLPASWEVVA